MSAFDDRGKAASGCLRSHLHYCLTSGSDFSAAQKSLTASTPKAADPSSIFQLINLPSLDLALHPVVIGNIGVSDPKGMKITILTAALNPGSALRDCLESVAGQRLPVGIEVEHIVLDGASTDGTVAALERWAGEGPGRAFRSGPDGGFYEALNSGIRLAGGDVVGILNADDYYFDGQALARVVEAFSEAGVDGVYGDLVYVAGKGSRKKMEKIFQGSVYSGSGMQSEWRDNGSWGEGFEIKRYWKSGNFRAGAFRLGWMPPHPTIFVRREVYEACGGFRTDFGSAADYEWILRVMLKRAVPFAYIPHVLVAMREGGMSNRSLAARLAANRNDRRAWVSNSLTPLPWTFLLKPLRKLPQWFARFSRRRNLITPV